MTGATTTVADDFVVVVVGGSLLISGPVLVVVDLACHLLESIAFLHSMRKFAASEFETNGAVRS